MASQFVSSSRSHLPAWNRTGLCRKSGTDVRKLARDGLSPVIGSTEQLQCTSGSTLKGRVVQLEKNMLFLKQQHHDTLEHLHKEIEKLKRVNRELNFKLVMCRCGQGTAPTLPKEVIVRQEPVQPATPRTEHVQVLYMPEDMQRLKNSLVAERSKNKRLLRFLEKKELERQKSSRIGKGFGYMRLSRSASFLKVKGFRVAPRDTCICAFSPPEAIQTHHNLEEVLELTQCPLSASRSLETYDSKSNLNGSVQQCYRVGGSVATHARLSTLEECEAVIRCLESKNSQQAHELLQIKADLRDILHSHKWTPDTFLMARAYVSEDGQGSSTNSQGLLPQVVPVTSRLEKAYQHVKEEVTLPSLKPKFSNMVAERHRRVHAIRGRTSKGIL